MPGRSREDLFNSVERGVLIGCIPSSVGIFRSFNLCPVPCMVFSGDILGGLCPIQNVVLSKRLVENACRKYCRSCFRNSVSCPRDKSTIWLERFIKHIF